MGRGRHANFPIVALGGAPYGATKRVRGVPNWWARGEQRHDADDGDVDDADDGDGARDDGDGG
eukprot:3489453-Pyramimonas_sp.AAC.1